MPSWPATLPQFVLVDGFRWSAKPNVVSFGTEVGAGKVRRRSTSRTAQLTPSIAVTTAQLADFRTFFQGDLKDGALSFDWVDPTTQAAASLRFDPTGTPYTVAPRGLDWVVSMSLQRLS